MEQGIHSTESAQLEFGGRGDTQALGKTSRHYRGGGPSSGSHAGLCFCPAKREELAVLVGGGVWSERRCCKF